MLPRGSKLQIFGCFATALSGIVALVGGAWFTSCRAGAAEAPTLFYIPHTHWEGAVFKTREEYLEMGLPHILQALALLKAHPDFKFTLDQVAYIKPFLERYPEAVDDFRHFVDQGRLEIVGGMDVMPDDVKPGGELFIRQMQYGQRFCRQVLRRDVTVGWFLDTFGHHPQLPQLLRLAGYKSFWFCRGVPSKNLPSEFLWEGIDGTSIPAFWLPGFYGLFYGPPRRLPEFAAFFKNRFDSLAPHARGNERVGLAGVDVSEPEEYVPPLIGEFNAREDRPFTIRYAVPTDFEAVVARRPNQPVISADMNPIFPGTYSSRPELKQLTREIEEELITAEKLGCLGLWFGKPLNQEKIWRAWEPVLFNQTHDLASGVMTDHVYEDTLASYEYSRRLAGELIEGSWASMAGDIDTEGVGTAVVVFNTLSWTRSDVAQIDVGFTRTDVRAVQVAGPDGEEVPVQLESEERYSTGGLKQARAIFIARDLPALGYAVYHLLPQTVSAAAAGPESGQPAVLENEYLRASVDLGTGAITSLFDKTAQWEALAGSANVIARQTDHGDLWELYHGLDGASYIAGNNRQEVPKRSDAQLSTDVVGTNGVVYRGAVFSEAATSHALGNGSFATRVRVYRGLRRVEIASELINQEKYVRYQALFATSIKEGRYFQEIPFGAVERAPGIEFPAQQWADWSDGNHGVAILNCGAPGNLVSHGTLMLSLLRAENLGHYGFGGGYEPGMSSETGFELGRRLTFRYALLPHAADWRTAQVSRQALELNHPLLVHKDTPHPGQLPKRWGFLEIEAPNIVLTAAEPSADGATNLRLYEAEGKPTKGVRVRVDGPVKSAATVNLLDRESVSVRAKDGAVELDFHAFEIKTLQLNRR